MKSSLYVVLIGLIAIQFIPMELGNGSDNNDFIIEDFVFEEGYLNGWLMIEGQIKHKPEPNVVYSNIIFSSYDIQIDLRITLADKFVMDVIDVSYDTYGNFHYHFSAEAYGSYKVEVISFTENYSATYYKQNIIYRTTIEEIDIGTGVSKATFDVAVFGIVLIIIAMVLWVMEYEKKRVEYETERINNPTETETLDKLDTANKTNTNLRKEIENKIIEKNLLKEDNELLDKTYQKLEFKIADLIAERDLLSRRISALNKINPINELELENLIIIKHDSDLKSCLICKTVFVEGEQILACPHCMSAFHEQHIKEWVKVKGTCPTCVKKL